MLSLMSIFTCVAPDRQQKAHLNLGLSRACRWQVDQLELAQQAVARGLAVVALVDQHGQLHLIVVNSGEDLQPHA